MAESRSSSNIAQAFWDVRPAESSPESRIDNAAPPAHRPQALEGESGSGHVQALR